MNNTKTTSIESKPTKAELEKYLTYESSTGIFTWIAKTHARSTNIIIGSSAGCESKLGYNIIWFKGKAYKAHDLAFVFITGNWPQLPVIHLGKRNDDRFTLLRQTVDICGVEITQEFLQFLFTYDEEQGLFIRNVTINPQAIEGTVAGGKTKPGYIVIPIGKERYYAHRLAFMYKLGKWPEKHVDHINSCPWDNSWKNLRECSVSENMYNTKLRVDNKTGYKGIFYDKNREVYLAYITVQKIRQYLGTFDNLEKAVNVVETARLRLHYDFANLG